MLSQIKKFALLVMISFLGACQAPNISTDVATEIAEKFIAATTSANYDEAFKLVNEKEFFIVRDRETWIEYYKAISKELGPIISVKLSRHQADDRFSGRFYTYQFSIKHEGGFTKEIVTLIQEINTKEELKVFAHRIEGGKLAKINSRF